MWKNHTHKKSGIGFGCVHMYYFFLEKIKISESNNIKIKIYYNWGTNICFFFCTFLYVWNIWLNLKWKSLSPVFSLWPHGLYNSSNSPGQNTGVGSLSLLQGIFPTQGSNPGLLHFRRIFTSWATIEALNLKEGDKISLNKAPENTPEENKVENVCFTWCQVTEDTPQGWRNQL